MKRKKKFTKQTPKVLDWSDSSKKNFMFCIKPTPPTIISCLTSFLVKRVARLQSMEKMYYYERSNFFTLKMKRSISRCLFWIAISEKVKDCTDCCWWWWIFLFQWNAYYLKRISMALADLNDVVSILFQNTLNFNKTNFICCAVLIAMIFANRCLVSIDRMNVYKGSLSIMIWKILTNRIVIFWKNFPMKWCYRKKEQIPIVTCNNATLRFA